MSSSSRQYSASPVLTMPPQPPHQPSFGASDLTNLAQHHLPSQPLGQPSAQDSFAAPAAGPTSSGRKRSRDEAAINLEPDPIPAPPSDPEEGWTYGEGMVLIKPNSGYVGDASTQSGTWVEEHAAADEESQRKEMEQKRPIIRSHKSQRVGAVPDEPNAPGATVVPGLASTGNDVVESPAIDQFTLQLGIGWRRISEDEHIQAAARGWARYIENHYPVTNATVRLESKGLQSYLVESTEGFFLFADDLRQGRLVSQDANGALRNLQSTPPIFDSPNTLVAAESPRPVDTVRDTTTTDAEMAMA